MLDPESVALLAAIIALVIGAPQVLALRQQNRISAFDRRFDAFLQVQEALQRACVSTDKPEFEDIYALNRALQKCWFLFPRRLSERLDATRKNILEMRALHFEIWDELGNAKGASNETLGQFHRAQRAAVAEWESLLKTFRPHMNLDFWS